MKPKWQWISEAEYYQRLAELPAPKPGRKWVPFHGVDSPNPGTEYNPWISVDAKTGALA